MTRARAALIALAAGAVTASAPSAAGDSFTPVALEVGVAPIARLHRPLPITVQVTADASVLDIRGAPLRVRVKLAAVCGGEFEHTVGRVLLDERLSPQPSTGTAFAATVSGHGRPAGYGVFSVCAYLEEEGDERQFATATDRMVNVSRSCTVAARRYDRARGALPRRPSAARRARVARLRRSARRSCGSGVRL
jgi:hypothetical protein